MPKYFISKGEQLHAEAFATLLIIEDRYFNHHCSVKLVIKARNRVYRRWEKQFSKR